MHGDENGTLLAAQTQLRSLALQLTRTEACERRRLATRVHDEIGPALATARINLGLALQHDLPREVGALLRQTDDLILQAIRETRGIVSEMSPSVLYELGLRRAVEWAAERIGQQCGLSISTSFDGAEEDLEAEVQAALFHACRELLVNAGKHSRAAAVRLSLVIKDSLLSLEVEDDGVGLDLAGARERILQGDHFGIFSIRERFESLGGALDIDSVPGRGTRVRVTYPLRLTKQEARS